jgi:hypothetical protein
MTQGIVLLRADYSKMTRKQTKKQMLMGSRVLEPRFKIARGSDVC